MSILGQQLIENVRALVIEQPDFVYDAPVLCVNVHQGQPSCLIGRALWMSGLIGPELENDKELNNSSVGRLLQELKVYIDFDEARWLRMVQRNQDGKYPWGQCVRNADAAGRP